MAPSAVRRVLVLGLLAGCLALLPFLRDSLGESRLFLPACLSAAAAFDLLTAALLAVQFLARGSSQRLLLACAFLAAGLLAVVHLLVAPEALTEDGVLSAGAQAPAWLWAIGHGGLPLGLAAALWGGPANVRRRLAGPTARRTRALVWAFLVVVLAAFGLAYAIVALGDDLPTIVRHRSL
jgi:hypothetical protein